MKLAFLGLALLLVLSHGDGKKRRPRATQDPTSVEARLKALEGVVEGLSRQVMLQQFFVEEKVRSDGDSGVKQIRVTREGNKNYHAESHVGVRYLAMHDHANYNSTIGMGELMGVMNGVEFRTRHNDYKLRMPSRSSQAYHQMEDIQFPDVPESVLQQNTTEEEIQEMREYFKAFKFQNVTHRDYRPYFKPVLCYMEGAWSTDSKKFREPFQSDRHHIDAASWFDLMDKVRFSSYSGSKSILENFAYLPTTIISVENGVPQYAQWNYRILCHPIEGDLPLSSFELQDDLLFRFPRRTPINKMRLNGGARFKLNRDRRDHYVNSKTMGRSLLDELMEQIPGKNNYPAEFHDDSFGIQIQDIKCANKTLLNTGYYHRYFKQDSKGAMGTRNVHRGYSDSNLFVAQTNNTQVAKMSVNSCVKKVCNVYTVRYSYALPLEIIYLTPLFNWNPYDLPTNDYQTLRGADLNRTGLVDPELAFNGTNGKNFFYRTPAEFFGAQTKTQADTAKNAAGVLDKEGNLREVTSSGQRIFTPSIDGVGQVRLRYPIMPVHGEGSSVWKELNALKDMTMRMNRYASLFEERPDHLELQGNETDASWLIHYTMAVTHQTPPGEHTHDVYLNVEERDELKRLPRGTYLTVTTSEDMGHSHELLLIWGRNGRPYIVRCDGKLECWDGHPKYMIENK